MKNGTRVQINPTTFNSFLSFSNGRSEVKWSKCCSVMSDSLQPHELYSPKNSPGQNTGVGNLSLIQGIFPTQQSNPGLPHCRRILYQLSHQGSPRILERVAYPFSSGSSQPRNQTKVSCITARFFTNWAITTQASVNLRKLKLYQESFLTTTLWD